MTWLYHCLNRYKTCSRDARAVLQGIRSCCLWLSYLFGLLRSDLFSFLPWFISQLVAALKWSDVGADNFLSSQYVYTYTYIYTNIYTYTYIYIYIYIYIVTLWKQFNVPILLIITIALQRHAGYGRSVAKFTDF